MVLAIAGCEKKAIQPTPVKPPDVVVDHPVIRDVQDSEEFPGRTEPVKAVEIRAQVTGALEAIHFKDGADVVAGQKLFTIDSRVFRAELEKATANLTQTKARVDRLTKDYVRLKGLKDSGVGSIEEFDRILGDKAEAEAAVKVAEASVQLAQTNLEYCTITAPFAGRASRRAVDPGNLIKANETALTTIVALDPIYVYFEVDERTLLRLRRIVTQFPSSQPHAATVGIALADETGFPRTGTVDFMDNQLNSGTGTLRVRAVVDNKSHMLAPGLFCRLRLPVGPPHRAVLVPDEAVGSDQGQKYVFVVNDKDEVVFRPVQLGFLSDRMRVIDSGLSATDRIIVKGLQRVRPGIKVTPKFDEVKPAKTAGPQPADAKKS
jgi:RND family efflux transporter MFP subunit